LALESITASARSLGRAPLYLHTSPEYAMKRLLAAGSGDIYQLCRVFRDDELGRWHQPEFTLLEWYRVGFDDARLMDEVDELLRAALADDGVVRRSTRVRYSDALERALGVDARASPVRLGAELLAALERGLPDCSGVAVGVDRLVALALGLDGIAAAMSFAHSPPRA